MPELCIRRTPQELKANINFHLPVNALSLARRNTGFLVALLYLQDIFWLIASRIKQLFFEPIYLVSSFEWPLFVLFILISILFAGISLATARLMRPIRRIPASRGIIPAIILLAIAFNLLQFFYLSINARYNTGALTGAAGLIYFISQALNMAVIVIAIRGKKCAGEIPKFWILFFSASLVLKIDGLASALLIGMFALILFDIRIHRPGRAIALFLLSVVVLWIGFQAKFSYVPDYLTPEFMFRWSISRFAIQAEQMYTFLAGQSVIGNDVPYLDLVFRAFSDRLDIVMGNPLTIEYPRSVSEATFFDMQGAFGAGSSPGALLGTALQGAFFFLPPFFFSFLFMQFFYGIIEKATITHLLAYSFIFKALHSNFSEFLTIISPVILLVAVYLVSCLIAPRLEQKSNNQSLEIYR
jgi:hypothetical protein